MLVAFLASDEAKYITGQVHLRRRRNGYVRYRSTDMSRRVVVTGMGAITPIGNSVEEFWNGLKEKKVGIAPITYFDTTDYKAKLAAEVKGFRCRGSYMDPKAAAPHGGSFASSRLQRPEEAVEDAGH